MLGKTPSFALSFLLALLLVAPPARSEEEGDGQVEAGKALVAAMAAARKAKDTSALESQAKQAVEIHNAIEDKGVRGKLLKELAAVLKSKHFAAVHVPTIQAVAELDDGKEAFKLLKKSLPGPKDEEIDDAQRAALAALDKLAPDSAIKTLQDLAEKADSYEAGALAIDALGSFKRSAKKRVAILENLVKLIGRFMPPRGQQAGAETMKRWEALGPPLIRACNELTGQKVGDPDAWITLWRDNKKRPDALFTEQ